MASVMHAAEIWRILRGIGWPITLPEFERPYDLLQYESCQLMPGTKDGFYEKKQS